MSDKAEEDWAAEVDEQERQITGQVSDMPSISRLEHVRKFSVLPVTYGFLLIFSPENSIGNCRLIKCRMFAHQVTLNQ